MPSVIEVAVGFSFDYRGSRLLLSSGVPASVAGRGQSASTNEVGELVCYSSWIRRARVAGRTARLVDALRAKLSFESPSGGIVRRLLAGPTFEFRVRLACELRNCWLSPLDITFPREIFILKTFAVIPFFYALESLCG